MFASGVHAASYIFILPLPWLVPLFHARHFSYCFVHFSYSRESNERDGMVEQDAVWASCFLSWAGAGAGWVTDLAQAFLFFNGFWLGMRTGGLGGGRLYTQCLGLHYLFHFKSRQSSRAGPSKGLVRAFLCIYGRRVECPGGSAL